MFVRVFMAFLVSLQVKLSDADCRTMVFSPHQETNKKLINHVVVNITVDTGRLCRIQCYLNHDCISYNIGPSSAQGMILCQLNNADRHQYPLDYIEKEGYTYIEAQNSCKNDSCIQNATCQSGFGPEGFKCVCPKGFTGSNCEIEIIRRIQANTSPVCIGTKNDSYGTFKSPVNGAVKSFQMVHISGGVAWGGGAEYEENWGDNYTKLFEIHITSEKNKRIAPPADYKMEDTDSLQYSIPGESFDAPNFTFPEFSPRLTVRKDQVFRVWYGEDLVNFEEEENSGTTCANVFIEYRPS